MLRIQTGDAGADPSDTYALRRENESLKAQMEALNTKGFEVITQQVRQILGGKQFGDNSQQLSKLIADNEELRIMIAKLFEKGIPTSGMVMPSGGAHQMNSSMGSTQGHYTMGGPQRDPKFRAP